MVVLSMAAAFLLGVYLGDGGNLPPGALASFALAAALFALLLGAYRRSALPALLLLAAVLGVARSGAADADSPNALAAYHDSATVRLQGVVVSDAEAAGSALRFWLAADRQHMIEVYSHYSISPLGMRTAFVDGQEQRLKKTHWNVIDTAEFEFGPNGSHRAVASFGRRMTLEVDGERVASL